MMLWSMVAVHWLHVMAGAFWFGAAFVFTFGVWPVLLQKPAPESKALYDAIAEKAGPMFAIAGNLTLWLGLLRGTYLGQIKSFDVLFGTAYGHTFLTALILTIAFMVQGGRMRARLDTKVWNGDRYHPGASAYVWRSGLVSIAILLAIVACMVAMHFGM